MKKSLLIFVAVLVVTVAGVAWAGQTPTPTPAPTVQAADQQVAPATEPTLEPEVKAGDEISLEELFVEPAEAGACCVAQCWEIWGACYDACNNDIPCQHQCTQERLACKAQC